MLTQKLDDIIALMGSLVTTLNVMSDDVELLVDIADQTALKVKDLDTTTVEINDNLLALGNYVVGIVGQVGDLTLYDIASQTLTQTVNTVDRLNRVNDKLDDLEVTVSNPVVVTNSVTHPALNVIFEV